MDIEKAKKVFEKYINGKDTMKETLIKAIEVLLNELDKLEEYKKIAELTKISCCTAQNCEALNNAIKEGLENQKLKVELDKKEKIINEYLKECYQFRAFCRRVRKDKKQDVDMFNQGREYSYIQFLNLVQGEENWSYEGNNFKKVEKELEQYTKKVEGK